MAVKWMTLYTGLIRALLMGCGSNPGPELALLYTPAAQYHGPDRNPIIVIPGILGSRLRDKTSGRLAWGAFDGRAADPADPDGARLIALPVDGQGPLATLRDDVIAASGLDLSHATGDSTLVSRRRARRCCKDTARHAGTVRCRQSQARL